MTAELSLSLFGASNSWVNSLSSTYNTVTLKTDLSVQSNGQQFSTVQHFLAVHLCNRSVFFGFFFTVTKAGDVKSNRWIN